MELISALANPVVLIVMYALYYLIVGLTKIVIVRMAIKDVPPENRAQVIEATSTMFKHGPLVNRIPGIRGRELSGKAPMDGDE
jgi:hypothetical protein